MSADIVRAWGNSTASRIEWMPDDLSALADRAAAFSTLQLWEWLADDATATVEWKSDVRGNDLHCGKAVSCCLFIRLGYGIRPLAGLSSCWLWGHLNLLCLVWGHINLLCLQTFEAVCTHTAAAVGVKRSLGQIRTWIRKSHRNV